MRHLAALASLLVALPAQAVVFDWLTIGNTGNSNDPATGYGGVSYEYQISKYETTNAQYVEFLNAVADADPNGLYNTQMGSNPTLGGITRSGSPGSYTYAAKAGHENRAVNFTSYYDALRMVNWMHNGEPTGAQSNATTEDGAYTITVAGMQANDIQRNPGAQVFIPSEDEWYKAAYYDGAGGYTNWPTPVDDPIECVPPSLDSGNSGNCWPASLGDGGRLYDVGAYTLSASHYGTFDQGGSVWEWNEAVWPDKSRGIRGSSHNPVWGIQFNAQALVRWDECAFLETPNPPDDGCSTAEIDEIGFRVARLTPSCVVNADCNDSDVCTDDICNAGVCSHPFNTAPCDDGVACTSGDICGSGTCGGTDSCPGNDVCNLGSGVCEPPECIVDLDCNDSDVCTDDTCVNGTCSITFNTAPCDDGLTCTSSDVCSAGICNGTDTCPLGEFCDPGANMCEDIPAAAIEWQTIGAPGNAGDAGNGGYGAVAYSFQISRTETSNAQYTSFLNAVAANDTFGLYTVEMSTDPVGGINRSGAPGSYSYTAKTGQENQPVTFVNFYDALRFANWVHNGQPAGAQDNTTTEDGAYTITAPGVANNTITRNTGAQAFLTSEDEWYKAAYYDGVSAYGTWPTVADNPLDCVDPGLDTGNAGNCWPASSPGGGLTDVGAYTLSPSSFGTFDQGANVWEWNEAIESTIDRIIRGGAWDSSFGTQFYAQSSVRFNNCPECDGNNTVGFRIARPLPGAACNVNADCDDGLFCNGAETCNPGVACIPGVPPTVDDGVACTDDSCDEVGDVVVNAANNANCDDALFCNGAETCDPALDCQAGTPVPVDDGVACTDDSCDEVGDVVVNAANNANCDDALFCNGAETCDPALDCQAGTPVPVDDGVACTDDSCDEVGDVVVNAANNANCDDALFCNGAETCDPALDCQAGTPVPVDDGVACTDDSCDEVGDVVVNAANNANCDDALFCNGVETCDPALDCQAGTPVPVDDGVACTDDSCDEVGDVVVNAANDTNCDDALFCNGVETCDPALDCQAGTPVPVDDGVACTDDSCDEVGDVVVNAANDTNCDDALFCNGVETCDPALDCQAGTPVPVDDGVACTDDSCDEVGDVVVNAANDTNCDDALFCNGVETCDPALDCQAGTPVPVDDGVACTDDSCDEVGDVVVNAANDTNCDDALFCNGVETCDPALDCQAGTPVPVDDGVACTDDSCDEVGDVVVNAPNDANCDPPPVCMTGICDAQGGCSYEPIPGCQPPIVPALPPWAGGVLVASLVAFAGRARRERRRE